MINGYDICDTSPPLFLLMGSNPGDIFFFWYNIIKSKTSLRSPSMASRVMASSPARFDRKVGRGHKSENNKNAFREGTSVFWP